MMPDQVTNLRLSPKVITTQTCFTSYKNQQAANGSPDEQTLTADFASPSIRKSSKLCSLRSS